MDFRVHGPELTSMEMKSMKFKNFHPTTYEDIGNTPKIDTQILWGSLCDLLRPGRLCSRTATWKDDNKPDGLFRPKPRDYV